MRKEWGDHQLCMKVQVTCESRSFRIFSPDPHLRLGIRMILGVRDSQNRQEKEQRPPRAGHRDVPSLSRSFNVWTV